MFVFFPKGIALINGTQLITSIGAEGKSKSLHVTVILSVYIFSYLLYM